MDVMSQPGEDEFCLAACFCISANSPGTEYGSFLNAIGGAYAKAVDVIAKKRVDRISDGFLRLASA